MTAVRWHDDDGDGSISTGREHTPTKEREGGRRKTMRDARIESKDEETYDNVVTFKLVWIRLDGLAAEALAVDEGAVGAFHVLDEDLKTNIGRDWKVGC